MAITLYSELQTAAANWLARADLTSRIPEFIALAEAKFNRTIRAREMLYTNPNFAIGNEYVGLPSDFLEFYSLYLLTSPRTTIGLISADGAAQDYGVSSDKPRYCRIVGQNIQFSPVPDGIYTGVLTYYSRIPALSSTVTTNWLLTYHQDVYLYGTCLEAAPYLGDDPRITTWSNGLSIAQGQIDTAGRRAAANGPSLTTRAL